MQKIKPCLWFDHQAEEAANFYVSVFPNSRITGMNHYGEGGHMPAGTVLTVSFELDGQEFMALNGGPIFPFTEAISLVVNCADQAELDRMWETLTANGGKEVECGWLKDKYGLSWQIVPAELEQLITDEDPERSQKVMQSLLKMKKLDLNELKRVHASV